MKGTILITLGKFEEAKKCFEEVLKSVPQDPHSHMNIAACETYLGRKKEALDFIKKAIRLAPKDVYILVGASLLSNELGEENKYMTKAVEINPYTAFAYMGAVAKEHLENPNTSSKAKESIRKTLNSSKRIVDEMKALEDASKKKKK
jgi:tetratricopeptide (TPR) repeat protein